MEEGRSRNSLRLVAELLISYAPHLPLNRAEVYLSDIYSSAETWARHSHRAACSLPASKREFICHATKWLRLLGRLRELQLRHPFALERDAFLQFLRCE